MFQENSISESIFVAGGFAEVTAERCTVLAEEAERIGDIDRDAVEKQLAELREDLSAADSEAARSRVEKRIAVAAAKLIALDTPAYQ